MQAKILVLTADPTGLTGGATYTATLSISTTGKTESIPVSLSVGDIWSVPNSKGGSGSLFLPVIIR